MKQVFHGFEIREKLGSGGMSTVYRGSHQTLGYPVAVKVLHPALAGDENFIARFEREARSASSLRSNNIVTVIEGNPDETTPDELHAMCLPRLDQHMGEQIEERAEELGDAIHGGLGSTDLQDIVVAAHDGRIAILFVDRGLERWGRLDPAKRQVSLHDERRPGDEDLVDLAMAETLAHRGSVVPNVPEGVEADVPIAAIYRHA